MNMLTKVPTTEFSTVLSDKEYRAVRRDSYSSIYCFRDGLRNYYRKYVVGVNDEDPTPAMINGSLVDCFVFTPGQYEERFYESTAEEPAPQMLKFTKNLVKRIIEQRAYSKPESMKVILLWAYNDTKYDKYGKIVEFKKQSFEKTVQRFFTECKEYCKELLVTHDGKILISQAQYDNAKRSSDLLKQNTETGPLLSLESNDRFEVYKQLVIFFELWGLPIKSMLDLVVVDHQEQKVKFYDLKTTGNLNKFSDSYLKYGYYIQLGVYTSAIASWMRLKGIEDYILEPMSFIVIESSNLMAPLFYDTTFSHFRESVNGFVTSDEERFLGIHELIKNIQWHKKQNIWNISKENYERKGFVQLKSFCNDNKREQSVQKAFAN